tara:strand:- start:3820 stop:4095 length:276 start_codon:yes stop_codon:yes gene_type:complete
LKGVKILKEKCTVDDAQDRSLPYTAYLVEYKVDEKPTFDIAVASKAVELFDYYYDLYKKDFVKFTQSEGRQNPKTWVDPNQPKPPKKGRKK